MSSFRSLLLAIASAAVVLASCGAPTADDVDPGGGAPYTGPAATDDASADEEVVGAERADPAPDPSPDDAPTGDDDRPRDGQDPAAEPTAAHAPAPAAAPPFELSPDEMLPNAKRLASDVVQTLLTYEPEQTAGESVAAAVGDRRADALLVTAAPLLHPGAWSRAEIVYPQLGGFTADSASVMVVARQTVGFADGRVQEETRTFDVRLVIEDGSWTFDQLASAGGRATERPDDLSEAALTVVDDDRIELPDTARWDIYRGVVEEPLLELMALMADRTDYGVIVLDTGHPWEVFGTDRQSRHSLGRAVDLYRIDGRDVIDDREDGSATHAFVEWLYDQPEMTNMGAPWSLDDFGGRSFTDDLHQDHLHIESAAAERADAGDDPPAG